MRILLVEDAKDLGETIVEYLSQQHMSVDLVSTIAQAKEALTLYAYQCIIIDWMLPDGEGTDLCKYIKAHIEVPVIMTTARGQIDDKLYGFDMGADDYLVKPFDLRELQARIFAHVKSDISIYTIKNISINIVMMKILQGDNEIMCSNNERLLIKALSKNIGQPVTRSDLIDAIWGGDTWGAENNLDVLVSGLRKKLGSDIIRTIKGFGYVLAND